MSVYEPAAVAAPDPMAGPPPFEVPGQSPVAPSPTAPSPVAPMPAPSPTAPVVGQITDAYQLFVGALPQDITENELRMVFQTYGPVREVKILTKLNVSPAGSAFVFYETLKAAEDAIQVLHEQYSIRAGAKPIRVSWAKAGKSASKGASPDMNGKGDKGCKGCGKDSWGGDAWNGGGGDAWGKGGCDAWQQPQQSQMPQQPQWQQPQQPQWQQPQGGKDSWNGCGDAWNGGKGDAWNGGKGDAWNGGKGDCWSPPAPAWQDPAAGGWDSWKGGGKDAFGKGPGKGKSPKVPGDDPKRLYVGNLPADIHEESIRYVFGTYGPVDEVKIIGGRVEGRACAIVGMNTPEGASIAITALNGKYEIRPGEGALQVRIADKSKSRLNQQPY